MKALVWMFALIASGQLQAASFGLNANGSEPLYQTTLTQAIYQASRSDHLQDLTLHNAAGEQVPYALLPYENLHPTQVTQESAPLTIFPMQENPQNASAKVSIQLNTNAENTSVSVSKVDESALKKSNYLFDLGENHPELNKLRVDWQGAEGKLIAVEILSSDNLKDWSPIGQSALLKTTAAGQTILQNSITLDYPTDARYLQLHLVEPDSDFKLTAVNTEYRKTQTSEQPVLWQALNLIKRENKQSETLIDFEALGRYPASHLRIHLPQQNTITHVQILVRNKEDAPWQTVRDAPLYRLNKQGKDYTNADIFLPSTVARYWRLQFSQASGGIGAENPTLTVGWLPHTVVWNARGHAPFSLRVGEAPAVVSAVNISNLMENHSAEKLQTLPVATLMPQSNSAPAGNAWVSAPDYKRWLLWAGLVLGVLLLTGMAVSLLKGQSKE